MPDCCKLKVCKLIMRLMWIITIPSWRTRCSQAVWMHDLFIWQHFDVWHLGNPILCVYWHNTRCLSAVSETSLEALLDEKLQCDLGLGLLRTLWNWERSIGNVHRFQQNKNNTSESIKLKSWFCMDADHEWL